MLKLTLMGTGTSHGVPVIGCSCPVCTSKDRHDKRLRCAALAECSSKDGSKTFVLIDIGPEFRIQALKYKIKSLDAVLLTHGHADHIYGLDDIRIFSHTQSCGKGSTPVNNETPGEGLKFYGNKHTVEDVRQRFDYIFLETQIGGGKPKISLKDIYKETEERPLKIGDMEILPVPMRHGKLHTTGYIFSTYRKNGEKHSILYLTDCNLIREKGFKVIAEKAGIVDHAVIDGLREEPHATHFSYLQAVEAGVRIGAKHIWLTHMTHQHSHEELKQYLLDNAVYFPGLKEKIENGECSVMPGWDGLKLKI